MKTTIALLSLLVATLAACQTHGSAGVSALSDRGGALEQPVIQLFPRRDLDGWRTVWWVDNRPVNVWTFDDQGLLVCKGQPLGFIRTERQYKDFVLSFDWRFHPRTRQGGDGGVMLRITGDDLVWPRSIEAQILPLHTGDVVAWREFPIREERGRTNGEFTFRLKDNESRAGDWNHYEIHLEGDHMVVSLNGEVVNEVWGLEDVAGYIGFQCNGPEIQYQNVQLIPLN
jgi:hypothetical protein